MNFGIVRFPGSCDDTDAMLAARKVGDARILWHTDRDLSGIDAVIIPGGFSYGDYLRVGAIARFAPVMAEIERFAGHGGLVLGICNGFQVLCEAGLLPGALLPNTSLRFACRQVELEEGGQVALRYAAGFNGNGSSRDIAGICNHAGNVMGLMPHPEHAVDALTGSEDGLAIFRSAAKVAA